MLQISDKVAKYWEKKGKLELWTGAIAAQSLEDSHDENMKNREAESAFARRTLWGWKDKAKQGAKKMRQTILGDNIHTGTDLAKLAMGVGILATGIGLPIGGYFIADGLRNMQPDVVNNITEQTEDTDRVIELDLPE